MGQKIEARGKSLDLIVSNRIFIKKFSYIISLNF